MTSKQAITINRSKRVRSQYNSIPIGALIERNYDFPEWQRGAVWTKDQQVHLISSLFNGYPIPPLMLWKNGKPSLSAVDQHYKINDGGQRTRTIYLYVNNKLAVPSSALAPYIVYEKPCKLFFKDLPEELQIEFLHDVNIGVVEMFNMPESAAIKHFIDAGENVKPLNRPELLHAQIDSLARNFCYKELPKTKALMATAIPEKRFGHEEQYSFLFQMVSSRFRTASPAKHLKDLFASHKDVELEEFNEYEQVKRTRLLVDQIKTIASKIGASIKTEQLHLLATFLYFTEPEEKQLEFIANWFDQFLADLSKASSDTTRNWTPWFAHAAKVFYSIPALHSRLKFMQEHYREWLIKTQQTR